MFAEHPDIHFVAVKRGQCLLFAEQADVHFIVVRRGDVHVHCLSCLHILLCSVAVATCTHTHVHACIHTQACMHTPTHAHTNINDTFFYYLLMWYVCMWICTHMQVYTYTTLI